MTNSTKSKKKKLTLPGSNVYLQLLSEEEIEQIRIWRNSEEISSNFIFREKISKEQQVEWFNKINRSENDYYYSIYSNGTLAGLSEIKKINWELKEGDAGLFIIPEFQNSLISFTTALILLTYIFEELKLKRVTIKVLSNNNRALRFNKFLGYKEYERHTVTIDNEELEVLGMDLHKEGFINFKTKIKTII